MKTELDTIGVETVEDLKMLDQEQIDMLAAKLRKIQGKKFAMKVSSLNV